MSMTRGTVVALVALVVGATLWTSPAAAQSVPDAGDARVQHPLVVISSSGPTPPLRPAITLAPGPLFPSDIQRYLGLTGDGRGETIGIVSAFAHPAIVDDLNVFSASFGLPLVCGTPGATRPSCINFRTVVPDGTPVDQFWALETALDVEWAHAVAPRANIILVEAKDDELNSMMAGVGRAIRAGATVVSGSWGIEEAPGQRRFDRYCDEAPAVCVFATGDSGNGAAYPATAASSVAVGGTSVRFTPSGAVFAETAWAGSGGGLSQRVGRPSYQRRVQPYQHRGVPDVSFHADPALGYAVYDSVGYGAQTGWFTLGGTSFAAPQWAGIFADANQLRRLHHKHRLVADGFSAQRALYGLAGTPALFDVTTGSNGACGAICTARPGYDFVTGLGSPRAGIDAALAAAR